MAIIQASEEWGPGLVKIQSLQTATGGPWTDRWLRPVARYSYFTSAIHKNVSSLANITIFYIFFEACLTRMSFYVHMYLDLSVERACVPVFHASHIVPNVAMDWEKLSSFGLQHLPRTQNFEAEISTGGGGVTITACTVTGRFILQYWCNIYINKRAHMNMHTRRL